MEEGRLRRRKGKEEGSFQIKKMRGKRDAGIGSQGRRNNEGKVMGGGEWDATNG